mmetsp:Transcript_18312/g.55279  ORF Transcript_18312/g.55279 Transcript_18312/m.55279 type:complete len:270 (-) Transcript_18312:673-1482(-)
MSALRSISRSTARVTRAARSARPSDLPLAREAAAPPLEGAPAIGFTRARAAPGRSETLRMKSSSSEERRPLVGEMMRTVPPPPPPPPPTLVGPPAPAAIWSTIQPNREARPRSLCATSMASRTRAWPTSEYSTAAERRGAQADEMEMPRAETVGGSQRSTSCEIASDGSTGESGLPDRSGAGDPGGFGEGGGLMAAAIPSVSVPAEEEALEEGSPKPIGTPRSEYSSSSKRGSPMATRMPGSVFITARRQRSSSAMNSRSVSVLTVFLS